MALKKKLAAGAFSVLALGGIGAGVANAATPSSPAPSSSAVDTPTPGDTPDAPGTAGANVKQGDQTSPDAPGATDTPEAGDTADAPGAAGAADSGPNVQQGGQSGDQTGPDAPGAATEAGN